MEAVKLAVKLNFLMEIAVMNIPFESQQFM